ncbi:aarF domain-containing kinase [Pseudoalteromonas sp. BSi20311]|jgi:predicted unusual protein kinase regulating ubiquinone biosynthesis (AarF/ABC1/UbiB family)|uniref:ABC1 kinase family protein n=1 Tax=unclassified Pseudoalteromonas TaxID=194690 RepID=UPI000231B14C|nr:MULTISPECIES: AarF/ABC1/UbiB kinase family protein [unclassified Pseudoalteromonas]GAA65058.1 aarF domain-containing kinase [Pseudoalteromonas sp. BSi20311]GAA73226.1 aarF domain-containing kinase [Pseudoalteromonas sp. BSi20439]
MANERSVPTSRLSRFAKLGSLATGVATNMLVGGAKSALSGKGWDNKSLLLQPKNIENLATQLSHLRGAAMKLGQLLSMDAGDLLTPELAQLLSLLRADANPMPHKQLVSVLKEQWGDDWLSRFSHIELRPFAAASIGQVHLAYIENGDQLAVKIQYPGIAKSVVSDVDNVITLLTLSRLLPKELDIKPLVEEAKAQLLAEADYTLESQYLARYKNLLSTNPHFKVPSVYVEHSTAQVLTMEYVDAKPIEGICDLSAAERSHVAEQLINLFFKEMFEFKLIQTDPNFANFHYQPESQKIVLFDFGATREITATLSDAYLALFKAGSNNDRAGVLNAATAIGYFKDALKDDYKERLIDLFLMACEPLRYNGEFDFKYSELAGNIKDAGLQLSAQSQQWHTPPLDALFIHRKLAGLYLIAARLEAKINIKSLFSHY